MYKTEYLNLSVDIVVIVLAIGTLKKSQNISMLVLWQ